MFIAAIRALIGLGGFGAILLVVYLESILVFPEALRFICVPAAALGGIIGFGLSFMVESQTRLRLGGWVLGACLIALFLLLGFISSDYTWEFWVIYGTVFLGNAALLLLIGDGILRIAETAKPADQSKDS